MILGKMPYQEKIRAYCRVSEERTYNVWYGGAFPSLSELEERYQKLLNTEPRNQTEAFNRGQMLASFRFHLGKAEDNFTQCLASADTGWLVLPSAEVESKQLAEAKRELESIDKQLAVYGQRQE